MSLSCSADRNNPLDPFNPENKLVTIEGYVKTQSLPRIPLNESTVFLTNPGSLKSTDQNGYFKFEKAVPNSGWLKVQKEGYRTDSVYLDLVGKKNINLEIFLNELPHSDSSSLSSIVINYYFRDPKTYLFLVDKIVDKDNDIDSVFVFNDELNLNKPLEYNVSKKYYETSLSIEELKIEDIEATLGKEFSIRVKDLSGNLTEINKETVKRIIKNEVQFISPKDLDPVSANPTLVWKQYTPGFPFAYKIEVFTNETIPQLMWQQENISSDSVSVNVNSNLTPGDYYWVIWCVDNFNNKSCSKPASFTVQ